MSNAALALVLPAAPIQDPRRLVAAWLEGRSERTRQAYQEDLEDFRRFVGAGDGNAAAAALLSRGAGAANELVLAYRSAMVGRGLASATINRRLAALRSLVGLARLLGAVEWTLGIKNVKHERRRDTQGPGEDGVRALLAELERRPGPKGTRDRALFRLLLDLGLRRFEVVGLDLEHLELESARVSVLRKGKAEHRWFHLPPKTVAALSRWLEERGGEPGPLFTGFRCGKGRRLDGDGLYRMIRDLGREAGVPGLRPHKIRHSSITACRDRAHKAGIPIEQVLDFSGHADPDAPALPGPRPQPAGRARDACIRGLLSRAGEASRPAGTTWGPTCWNTASPDAPRERSPWHTGRKVTQGSTTRNDAASSMRAPPRSGRRRVEARS